MIATLSDVYGNLRELKKQREQKLQQLGNFLLESPKALLKVELRSGIVAFLTPYDIIMISFVGGGDYG